MTKQVSVGNLIIGGGAPVSVQTMYDIPLDKLEEGFDARMVLLKGLGCDLIRFSYPNIKDHDVLTSVVKRCPMPVVADIHFDYKNALDAIKCGVAKIRINPGNIGPKWKTQEIVKAAGDAGCAIRIGLNSGSLPENKSNKKPDELMVDTALEYLSWFENLSFFNTVVSLKASDNAVVYSAYKIFPGKSNYPLHLGITEAGGCVTSCVRSTYTLSKLLDAKIGDTLRYSITGSIEDEVIAGNELLRTMGLRKGGVRIVSCPMCGRKSFDSQLFLKDVQTDLLSMNKNITVAIMGCQVNGPGEAKNADIAISGIGNRVYLYNKGVLYKETNVADAKNALLELVEKYE